MRIPDWTDFRSAEADPCGPCCLLERAFSREGLPANYIWTIGYLGTWNGPEEADISTQVKSYGRDWLIQREKHLTSRKRDQQRQERRYREMADAARRERELRTETAIKNLEPEVVKQRIGEGPMAMAKGLIKSAGDLATGGVTDPKERMAICNVCPFKSDDGRCGKCGCVLAAKTRVKKSSCPIGRW